MANPSTKVWTFGILAVGFLALGLRLLALWSLSTMPYFQHPMIDEAVYHQWAAQLAAGTYASTAVYFFAPLPAYVMAAVYKVLSPDIFYIRLLNVGLGTATCVIICLLGTRLADRPVGLAAGVVAALYEPFILYSVVPLKTALSVFLFAIVIYSFVSLTQKPSLAKVLCLGLALGSAATVRENAMALAPVMIAMVLWNRYRDGLSITRLTLVLAVYGMGLLIATGPFLARNYVVGGELALTTQQAGFNLYLGNNPANPDPYYRPVSFAESMPYHQHVQFRIEAGRRAGRTLSHTESSRFWLEKVAQFAMTEPMAFAWNLLQKTLAVFNTFEAGDHYHTGFLGRFAAIFKGPWLTFAIIFPLGMAGMVVSVVKCRTSAFLGILFVVFAATVILFFPNGRYRLPFLIILIPFAAIGVKALAGYVKKRETGNLMIYASVIVVTMVVECLPVRATDDMSAYYNIHAMMLNRQGMEQEAVTYWERSASMKKPFSAFANLALAEKSLTRKDILPARTYLERIPDDSFAAASKHELLGDSFYLEGEVRKAMTEYTQSLAINSGRLGPRRKLVSLLAKTDPSRAAEELNALKYLASFYTGL